MIINNSITNQECIIKAFGTGDYQYIVSHGKRSLKYMLKKFASSNKDGLEEDVMARLCCSILEENKLENSWTTGRDWYESYVKRNE